MLPPSLKIRYFALATFASLWLAGCTSTPSKKPAANSAAAPIETSLEPATGEHASTEKEPPLPFGEYRLRIESSPAGATVVVNGIPVGKAPQLIRLPGTQRGYFRDQVSIKVRFLAEDGNHTSQTVEELLTPLDRIPAAVKFTPSGTTRVAR